jgi:hypothetical protein
MDGVASVNFKEYHDGVGIKKCLLLQLSSWHSQKKKNSAPDRNVHCSMHLVCQFLWSLYWTMIDELRG